MKKYMIAILTVLIALISCKSDVSVNEYIFPYISFTLSEDGSYYTASVVKDAALKEIYIPAFVDNKGSSKPVLEFIGFSNPEDQKNLKRIVFDSSSTKFKAELFLNSPNLETFEIKNIDEEAAYYDDLPTIEKEGLEFEGWYIKGTDKEVKNGDKIIDGYSILEPRWREHVFKNKNFKITDETHTYICDICHEEVKTEAHTKTWKHDLSCHYFECEICGYKSAKEAHVLVGEVGNRHCTICGFYEKEAEKDKEGFDVIVIDREPDGYIAKSQDGLDWTFKLISTNSNAIPETYRWYLDGTITDNDSDTYTLNAPDKRSYKVMCVFTANGYYASSSIVITGGN